MRRCQQQAAAAVVAAAVSGQQQGARCVRHLIRRKEFQMELLRRPKATGAQDEDSRLKLFLLMVSQCCLQAYSVITDAQGAADKLRGTIDEARRDEEVSH